MNTNLNALLAECSPENPLKGTPPRADDETFLFKLSPLQRQLWFLLQMQSSALSESIAKLEQLATEHNTLSESPTASEQAEKLSDLRQQFEKLESLTKQLEVEAGITRQFLHMLLSSEVTARCGKFPEFGVAIAGDGDVVENKPPKDPPAPKPTKPIVIFTLIASRGYADPKGEENPQPAPTPGTGETNVEGS